MANINKITLMVRYDGERFVIGIVSPPDELSDIDDIDDIHATLDKLWNEWKEVCPDDNDSWFFDRLEALGWRTWNPEQSHTFQG